MTSENQGIPGSGLTGTPSDQASAVLATGDSDASTLFVSMSERHPEGADADYLRWHTLDHRPEQQRLKSIRASLRVVSTPDCRSARAFNDERFDPIAHVMTYFFRDINGLGEFNDLGGALARAGRSPFILNPVERGVYNVDDRIAAPRIKIGADVIPWWPPRGIYILVEQAAKSAHDLIKVPGVAGIWSANSVSTDYSTAPEGQRISYFFLDEDPVISAGNLRPLLEKRWADGAATPLFAAPFYCAVPYEWDKYLP